ncbi:MAG: sulfatase-like hydrolase/transferase [Tannerella sp.]|jgi:arylsulfatase A-like enzyme|nr:sulfatase-like hydrolase/transferase [Tannerella sp.]
MLDYHLVENLMTPAADDAMAQTVNVRSYSNDQIADLMLQRGTMLTKADILAVQTKQMKTSIVYAIAGLGIAAGASAAKPNVILILTDDQGSIDVNCYGAKDLMTPNMDRLAAEGVRFTQFYTGSAISSPSRACILTGMTPQKAGLPTNTSSTKGKPGMPEARITIAEVLKKAGYTTAHVGKWHVGYSPETMPLGQGFDYSFGHMGGCIDNYSHFFYWDGPNRHDLWENGTEIYQDGKYFPDLMVDKATSFIKQHAKEPFFLYLAFNAPHYPLQPAKKWRDHYSDLPSPRKEYAGFVSSTDERIGTILDFLDTQNLRDNTIVIFLSDHGHSYEERTGGSGGNSGPYRGGKFSLFEGGIRVPAIISWKGHIPENQVCDKLCLSMDILPTIADLCQTNIPQDVEGKSIKTVIYNGKDIHRDDVIRWQVGKQWAVRKGDWKLIGNPVDPSPGKHDLSAPNNKLYLSNLNTDVSEKENLAAKYPDITKELIQLYQKWEYAIE